MLTLILAAVLDPRVASLVGATIAGHPTFAADLLRICERESHCTLVGVHAIDSGRSRAAWSGAVAVGWLDPSCQPHRPRAWSTRGAWGTMAAYTVHHLGTCVPAWALDVPLVAAIAATRRAHHDRCNTAPSCRRWRDRR